MRRLPAEAEPHAATWLAWPHLAESWPGPLLVEARREMEAFVRAIARDERVALLVRDAAEREQVAARLHDLPASRLSLHELPTDDAWLRDTGPLFVHSGPDREPLAVAFRFDAWGGRYPPARNDRAVAHGIAARTGHALHHSELVLEGGAIDGDGRGTLLASRRSLVCPRRNPGWSEREIELELLRCLGTRRVLWLDAELPGDDTDGHVDTFARFVAPGRVLLCRPVSTDHPARADLERVRSTLRDARDADGRRLELLDLPLPDPLASERGVLPATYANFYLTHAQVLVPTYGLPTDADALMQLAKAFPEREGIGLPATALLHGQGSLHCLAQPEFAAGTERPGA